MHQSLAKFSASEASNHTPSLADFTTTTPELKFSVHIHDRIDGDFLPLTQEALSQLLGVRRTTVTHVVRELRTSGAIRSNRRGLIEIDRPRLEEAACECHKVMRGRIDQIFPPETMKPRVQTAPVRKMPRDRDPFLAK
jgi:DNA-binding transcriptional MocR family regulator